MSSSPVPLPSSPTCPAHLAPTPSSNGSRTWSPSPPSSPGLPSSSPTSVSATPSRPKAWTGAPWSSNPPSSRTPPTSPSSSSASSSSSTGSTPLPEGGTRMGSSPTTSAYPSSLGCFSFGRSSSERSGGNPRRPISTPARRRWMPWSGPSESRGTCLRGSGTCFPIYFFPYRVGKEKQSG